MTHAAPRTPPHRNLKYQGTGRTVQEMLRMANGPRGAQSLKLRVHVENIVRYTKPRDVLSQMAAVYYWWLKHYGFLRDPVPSEMVRDPLAALEDIERYGTFRGDCDCAATFLTGNFRAIGIRAKPVRVGFRPPRYATLAGVSVPYGTPYSHVLAVARDQYGRRVAVDPVAEHRTRRMLRRTRRFG